MKNYIVCFLTAGYPFFISMKLNNTKEQMILASTPNMVFAHRFRKKEDAVKALDDYLKDKKPHISLRYVYEIERL